MLVVSPSRFAWLNRDISQWAPIQTATDSGGGRPKCTYWRCGPQGWYLGGCGYEYGKVETKVKDVKLNDVLLHLIDEARGSD